MYRNKSIALLLCIALFGSIFPTGALAWPLPTDTGNATGGPVNIKSILGKTARDPIDTKSMMDLFSGSAKYGYELRWPKWPRGYSPELSFSYSSQSKDTNSPCGYGWNCTPPSITRSTRLGTDRTYSSSEYLYGGAEYIPVGGGIYRARIASDDSSLTESGAGWIHTDMSGVKRYFGTLSARLTNPEKSDQTFAWYLEKVEAPTGERVEYSYTFDGTVPYLASVSYAFDEGSTPLYTLSLGYVTKPAVASSYRTNFLVEWRKLLSEISLMVAWIKKRSYKLEYLPTDTVISLLGSVEEVAVGEVPLPKTMFTYGKWAELGLLKTIDPSTGARHTLTYSHSSLQKTDSGKLANPNLPMNMSILSRVSTEETVTGQIYHTDIRYENGYYYTSQSDPYRREYAGFGRVRVIEPGLRTTEYLFYQGRRWDDTFEKKWKPRQVALSTSQGVLLERTTTGYTQTSLPSERQRVMESSSLREDMSSTGVVYATAKSMEYDTLGRLTRLTDMGEVSSSGSQILADAGDDTLIQEMTYISGNSSIRSLPSQVMTKSQTGVILTHKRSYYDGLALGQIGSTGLLTRSETAVIGENRYIATTQQYDNRNRLIASVDPLGNTTSYTQDIYRITPLSQTNPLGYTESLDYDYTIGTPRGSIDANSLKKYTTFDGYGRPISEYIQSSSGTAVLVSTRSYQDTIYPRSVTVTTKTLGGDKTDRVYLDGLDRPIQLRRSGYISGDWWVQDMTYDRSGNAIALSYPRTANSSVYDEPESISDITRLYDTRGRMTSETDTNGTSSFVYEPRSTRSIDRGGASRTAQITARGTLAAITESMGSGSRTTSYSYTSLGQISRLTDALGNIRDYAYDGLHRVTRLEDLHTLSDTSPLSISFAYDDASRMTRRTNQAGEYNQMTYDALGRTTKREFYTSSSNLSRTQNFVYDAGVYALWKLTSESGGGYSRSYTYSPYGAPSSVTTTLGAAAYTESTLSTPLGEVQSLTYPDGYSVSYNYQNGLLRGVSSGSGMIAEVDTYSPLGVPSTLSYGANIDRSMVYDKDIGMRLSRDTLQVGSTTLSDRTYTYDPDGNLTQLSQTGSSPLAYTGNYIYDGLSRLTDISMSGSGVSVNESYTYDLVSNRLTGPSGSATIGGSAGLAPGVAKSQLYRLSHDGSRGMEYDTKGNLTRITSGSGSQSFAYDTDDRMTRAMRDGALEYSYTYDSGNTRLIKRDIQEKSTTHYPSNFYEYTRDRDTLVDGSIIERVSKDRYIYLGGKRVALLQTMTDTMMSGPSQSQNQSWSGSQTSSGSTSSGSTSSGTISGSGTTNESGSGTTSSGSTTPETGSWSTSSGSTTSSGATIPETSSGSTSSWSTLPESGSGSQAGTGSTSSGTTTQSGSTNTGSTSSGSTSSGVVSPPSTSLGYPTLGNPISSTKLLYLLTDHLDSVGMELSDTGELQKWAIYHPFGREIVSVTSTPVLPPLGSGSVSGTHGSRYSFAGKEKDRESDVHYFEWRYYDDGSGRFTSVDPVYYEVGITQRGKEALLDPEMMHPYVYARNGPLRYVDPTGQEAWDWNNLNPFYIPRAHAPSPDDIGKPIPYDGLDLWNDGSSFIAPGGAWLRGVKVIKAVRLEKGVEKGIDFVGVSPVKESFWKISSEKLRSLFERNYRPDAKIWNWSAADAIRYTKQTGKLVEWSNHLQKWQDSINGLQKLLNWGSLNKSDANTAKTILNDLRNALNGK